MSITDFAKKSNVEIVDIRFTDLTGTWHHISVPVKYLDESIKTGKGFDGSSIPGFQEIHESDMVLKIDATAPYYLDPFASHPTLVVFGIVYDPGTKKPYMKDPRNIAIKSEQYLKETKLGDLSFFGPELEFFIFDKIEIVKKNKSAELVVYSEEFEGNHPQKVKGSYFPVLPDKFQNLRSSIVLKLQNTGIDIEAHHHEVAVAQHEIDMKFQPLTKMADQVQIYKNIVTKESIANGKTATFMEKPILNDNGSGMHVHQSIWKAGENTFAGDQYAGVSKECLWYIGGLSKHARALASILSPHVNSYLRYKPGFEAPNLASGYSARNRSAPIRIPMYFDSPHAKRLECRLPGPTANPYLAFSAMLLAGIDGIKNEIDPGVPIEGDMYKMKKGFVPMPSSLEEAVDELEKDHSFLEPVWPKEFIEAFIEEKRKLVAEWKKDPASSLRRSYSYGV